MKKIPCVFRFDSNHRVINEVNPLCQWVLDGEGIATVKWDGAACMVRGGQVFARYDAKHGKLPPEGFEPCQDPDPDTGHWPGWIPAKSPEHQYLLSALHNSSTLLDDGTYEALGPKINGGKQKYPFFAHYRCERHGGARVEIGERTFEGLKEFLSTFPHEGIVFHRLNSSNDMAKIRRKDFKLSWPV